MKVKKVYTQNLPRLPLEGQIDLTYRCNNNCLHCWLWTPDTEETRNKELTFAEIKDIADQARAMGCRHWSISGGEPLLRPDFPEIFEYLTYKCTGYSLNTNGTLITPEIARLLTRKGVKMVALYGATAEVYDRVTRHPGGFEKVMQGFENLKSAGAGFIVQLIPMQANWHQWEDMIALAKTLSPHWRVGAAWLYMSAHGSDARNKEIRAQRLAPAQVIELDKPNLSYSERMAELEAESVRSGHPEGAGAQPYFSWATSSCRKADFTDDRLFASCISKRRNFHIDAYGCISWCAFIKDSGLRFDLRSGTFEQAWNEFIPSCADMVRGGQEWRNHCGSCQYRSDCRWCAVYAYLETGRYSAPIPYLCHVAEEACKFKAEWLKKHRRYFRIAGITVCLESSLDLDKVSFASQLKEFKVKDPGLDNVKIRHFFFMPDLKGINLESESYHNPPWSISWHNGNWIYRGISTNRENSCNHRIAIFSADYKQISIFSPPRDEKRALSSRWSTLSFFADDIWLGQLMANRNAVILHAGGVLIDGKGLIFVGNSGAGKSTILQQIRTLNSRKRSQIEILSDERIILRKWPTGWRIHGTWRCSNINQVSPKSAPLNAFFFLLKSRDNKIQRIEDHKLIIQNLLTTVIRAGFSEEWWDKIFDISKKISYEVPCYMLHFDTSGNIIDELDNFICY